MTTPPQALCLADFLCAQRPAALPLLRHTPSLAGATGPGRLRPTWAEIPDWI